MKRNQHLINDMEEKNPLEHKSAKLRQRLFESPTFTAENCMLCTLTTNNHYCYCHYELIICRVIN